MHLGDFAHLMKGVGWNRQFNAILGGKDQHKKLCDSNRPGLYLERQRDSSILGHQRQPCFCAKVQHIGKNPCQISGHKIIIQKSVCFYTLATNNPK